MQPWDRDPRPEATTTTWQPADGSQPSATDRVREAAGQAQDKASHAVDTGKQKAGQVAEQASAKADAGIEKAAGGLDRAADMLREKGQSMGGEGGTMQAAATKTAEQLDKAAQFLEGKDTDQLMAELEALVRRRPTESLLVAAGVGFLLAKALR